MLLVHQPLPPRSFYADFSGPAIAGPLPEKIGYELRGNAIWIHSEHDGASQKFIDLKFLK